MNFRVGLVFENTYIRREIINISEGFVYSSEGAKGLEPTRIEMYKIINFESILEMNGYQEIPQKSNNFKLIYDILNGDTDTNTPGHSAS